MPFSARRPANRPCCRSARAYRSPGGHGRPDGGDRETRSPSPESGPGLPGRTRGRCPSTPSAGRAGDGAAPVPSAGRPASVPGVRGPGPPGEPGSVALSTPFTLTRLPVPSLASPSFGLRSSWGAPSTSVRCELPRLTTGEPADRPGSWWLLAPHRTRFRIVSRVRFPPRSTRRSVSKDSVSRPRCACAPRYGAHLRGRETAGQEVILNTQGYPPNFSLIPRKHCAVHRPCTSRAQRCPQHPGVPTSVPHAHFGGVRLTFAAGLA